MNKTVPILLIKIEKLFLSTEPLNLLVIIPNVDFCSWYPCVCIVIQWMCVAITDMSAGAGKCMKIFLAMGAYICADMLKRG